MTPLRFMTPIVIGLVASASIAAEPNCMQDLVDFGLQCTSRDVEFTQFTVLNGVTECVSGEDVHLQLQAVQVAQAFQRYDVGFFVALDGGNGLHGQCYHDYLEPPLSASPTPIGTQRINPFFNGEAEEDPSDSCGDIEKDVTNLKTLSQMITVKCQDTNQDQILDVSACTSWDNQKSTGTRQKPSCTSLEQTLPGTPSKCRCETVKIANVVVKGKIIIKKIVVPDDDPTAFTFRPSGFNNDESFTLKGGESKSSGPLSAGNYSIKEDPVAGWNTQSSCDDGSPVSKISLQAGEVVTCTFINMNRCPSVNCKDTNPCTADACDPNTGQCIHEKLTGTTCGSANETECDAGDLCVDGECVDNVKDEGVECRARTGVCDFAEVCDGINKTCPPDGVNSTLECSASNGECDLAEFCSDGSDNCPADGGNILTQCREATGVCDFGEFCSDASDLCPHDGPNRTTICREATGECDVAERCSDASDTCPGDAQEPDGTSCSETDNNVCTLPACVAGSCQQSYASIDSSDNNACTIDFCDPITGVGHSPIGDEIDDHNACTLDQCDPNGGVTHTPITCNDNNVCTLDSCSPLVGCVFTPRSCNDGNECTNDRCEPQTGCFHSQVNCNDNDRCTQDVCIPGRGCEHNDLRQPATN